MIKYLIDTDVLIDHIRGREYLDPKIISEDLAMSIITLGELLYGAYKSVNPERSLEKVNGLFTIGIEIENLDTQIIDDYAKQKIDLEKSSQRLDEFDLLIGCTAKVKNLVLITRNRNHFKRIKGLKLND